MTDIKDVLLTDLLPINLHNNHLKSLSYAVKCEKDRLLQYMQAVNFNSVLGDNVTEELVDLLAAENRALYYDETLPLETKKKLVKETLPSYMLVGTPAIIKRFLEITSEMVEIKEWFEYNGTPYHFSIYITMPGNAVVTEDVIHDIENKIERLKNARSVLDVVNIIKQFESETGIAMEAASYYEIERSLGETDDITLVDSGAKILVDNQGRILFAGSKMLIVKEV
jgi:P2-related tail formation protein